MAAGMLYYVKDFALHAKAGEEMFEKNLAIAGLLDVYGALLSGRQRTLLDFYYNQDFSLSEIADEVGISRQGVRDGIKKAEEELSFFEEHLRLLEKTVAVRAAAKTLLSDGGADVAAATEKLLSLMGISTEDEETEGATDEHV